MLRRETTHTKTFLTQRSEDQESKNANFRKTNSPMLWSLNTTKRWIPACTGMFPLYNPNGIKYQISIAPGFNPGFNASTKRRCTHWPFVTWRWFVCIARDEDCKCHAFATSMHYGSKDGCLRKQVCWREWRLLPHHSRSSLLSVMNILFLLLTFCFQLLNSPLFPYPNQNFPNHHPGNIRYHVPVIKCSFWNIQLNHLSNNCNAQQCEENQRRV